MITINCRKFLKRWVYQTCLLRDLYEGQEANGWYRTWDNGLVPIWERRTSRLYTVTLFNLYAEYIMRNAGLDEAQAVIKIAGRNTNNLRNADDTALSGRK